MGCINSKPTKKVGLLRQQEELVENNNKEKVMTEKFMISLFQISTMNFRMLN